MSKLDHIIRDNMDKWTQFYLITKDGQDTLTIEGILRGFTDDYVKIEGVAMRYVNLKAYSILGVITR